MQAENLPKKKKGKEITTERQRYRSTGPLRDASVGPWTLDGMDGIFEKNKKKKRKSKLKESNKEKCESDKDRNKQKLVKGIKQ